MRGLSLWNPYAALMAIRVKQYETRGRQTHVRGLVAIHAAQKWNSELCNIVARSVAMRKAFEAAGVLRPSSIRTGLNGMPFGAFVAVGELTGCISTAEWIRLHCRNASEYVEKGTRAKIADIHAAEYEFGDYDPGRFAWRFERVNRLLDPVPAKASQGFFTVPPEAEAAIRLQLPQLP